MSPISLKLEPDEALVLFELLARRAETGGRVELRHEGERRVLDRMEAALEAALVEPFAANYRELVQQALSRLAA